MHLIVNELLIVLVLRWNALALPLVVKTSVNVPLRNKTKVSFVMCSMKMFSLGGL